MDDEFPDSDDDELLSSLDIDHLLSTTNSNSNNNDPTVCKGKEMESEGLTPHRKRNSTSPIDIVGNQEASINSIHPKAPNVDTSTSTIITSRRKSSFVKTPKKLPTPTFPGPAGLLAFKPSEFKLMNKTGLVVSPKTGNDTSYNERRADASITLRSPGSQAATTESQDDSLSQDTISLLEKPTRSEILDHLELHQNSTFVLSTLNASWVHQNIDWLPNGARIPFLLIMLKDKPLLKSGNRSQNFKTSSVRCVDQTGAIDAAIEYNFVTKYASDLTPGTCLAIQNIPLLRLRKGREKPQISIAISTRNLICMTSFLTDEDEKPEQEKLTSTSSASFDSVKLTQFSEFVPGVIWRNYERLLQLKTNTKKDDQVKHGVLDKVPNINVVSETSGYFSFSREGDTTSPGPEEDDPFFEELDANFLDNWDGTAAGLIP